MSKLTWKYVEDAADLKEIRKVEDMLGIKLPKILFNVQSLTMGQYQR